MSKVISSLMFTMSFLLSGSVDATTVGPGTITTPVIESSGGTTTIVGNTTITTTSSTNSSVNVTNGTIELGGPNILIQSNAVGISVNASSFPAYLTSNVSTGVSISTSGANASYGISVSGTSPTSGVPLVSLQNASIQTTGALSFGIFLNNGASLDLTNSSITTFGSNSHGILFNTGASATLSNVNIETFGGMNTFGLQTSGANALTVDGLSIILHGGGAHEGLHLLNNSEASIQNLTIVAPYRGLDISGSVLNLDNAVITVSNGTLNFGAGILGVSGAQLNINNTNVNANGSNISGLLIAALTAASVTNSTITAIGSQAQGISVTFGSNFSGENLIVSAQGESSAGIGMTASSQSTINNIALTNATITSEGPGIFISGGTDSISLTDSNLSGSPYWLYVGETLPASLVKSISPYDPTIYEGQKNVTSFVAPSTATLVMNHSILTGSAFVDIGNTANVVLSNDSLWTMTDSSNLTSIAVNESNIVFAPPLSSSYKTLTVDNYSGQNATLSMNTFLGGSDSPSDLLVINGGIAAGTTNLLINNTTGPGALTTGNGILVVSTINDGTTAEGSFSLAAPVAAGPYEYALFKGSVDDSGPDNWYLRSTILSSAVEPNYRREVSLYSSVPSLLLSYNRSFLGTFHQRVGAEEQVQKRWTVPSNRAFFNGSWVRLFNRQGNIHNDGALKHGPSFKYQFYAVQAGMDVYHHQYDTGHRDFVGFFGSGGDNYSKVTHYTGINAGNADFKSYGAGVYWTHITPNGSYLDGVIQANWYDLRVHSSSQVLQAPTPKVYAYSLEAGMPFSFWKQWSIEPEAQISYQLLPGFLSFDSASQVSMDRTESLIGRIGGRVVWDRDPIATRFPKKRGNLSVWFTPSIAYEARGNSVTRFSSSTEWIPFFSTLKGPWFSMDLNATMQLKDYFSIYGTLLGETYLNGRGKAYSAMLGCRINV